MLTVCPNCHSMRRRCKPPFTPEELRALMDARNSNL
ncbi:HNH endonuclease [Escherichia coli]|nr:HNH endonuclease [Escherichia coli]PSZ14903.1 HNH endonuclease [Escherichia sp. 4726-5]